MIWIAPSEKDTDNAARRFSLAASEAKNIGYEAGTESSPELQFARATRHELPPHPPVGIPCKARTYDPACGSGPAIAGFVQSEKFIESHGGKCRDNIENAVNLALN